MRLYNTLTRQIDEIHPLTPPAINVYTCGPTVYDYQHIGNWFNYVRKDILIRTLKQAGMKPKWVMNITDVGHLVSDADDGEDKLEKGARREGKTAWEVAEFYTEDFLECMKALSITQPDHITKATDHIPEQIALIQKLEEKGYTYTISDGVYYDTSKFEGYAAFARLDLDGQEAGARVEFNSEKRNPTDFALWKFSPPVSEGGKQRDMEWDSPFPGPDGQPRKGFPGWHVECSAMSMKYLGDTLDIHTGGIDHIPVHHTNEIAQSEAATGKRFANYWLHSNHITVEGEKISKSLGNGMRLQAITGQGIPAEAVRLHVLESHYRSQSQFSLAGLQAAANRLKNWQAVAVLQWQPQPISDQKELQTFILEAATLLTEQLSNDLNTPHAVRTIDSVFTRVERELLSPDSADKFRSFLIQVDDSLGLHLSEQPDVTAEQSSLFELRQRSRDAKDWTKSDAVRAELESQGIAVRDTPHGPIWYRL